MTKLTLFDITKSCKLHGGYKTAELNNVLYLHYSGLSSLCEMKGYNPSCIWLQGNQLVEVSHMMLSVTCLYLQKNAIMNINGLDGLINLVELNLSNNMIQEINNGLPENLETLYISKNLISESDKLKNLRGLKKLCLLDISNNQIKDDGVVMILSNLELRVVNTEQNPFHNKARYFRKELIRALPLLNYLNSKPVEEDERRIVNAFFMGGKAAELDEKSRILSEKAAENRRHYKKFSKNHQNSDSGYEVSNWSIEQIQFYNKMINTVNEKESGINIFGDLLGSQKLVEDAEFENLNNSARTSFIMGHKIQKLD